MWELQPILAAWSPQRGHLSGLRRWRFGSEALTVTVHSILQISGDAGLHPFQPGEKNGAEITTSTHILHRRGRNLNILQV